MNVFIIGIMFTCHEVYEAKLDNKECLEYSWPREIPTAKTFSSSGTIQSGRFGEICCFSNFIII